ncbi:MAG: CatB-related O-acetyltransferase [Desulfovibrionaceae bacterium]|nr:CatB-related O-acetyltransferase [Desulfovibrionaceae bacterium]
MININPLPYSGIIITEDNVGITNIELIIGLHSYINSGFVRSRVKIGRYCSIGRNIDFGLGIHDVDNLSTHSFFSNRDIYHFCHQSHYCVILSHDVWIGDGVFIKQGVTIGTGAVVGAISVCTKDIPPYAIACGSPARIIRYRFKDDIISKLLQSKWLDKYVNMLAPILKSDMSIEEKISEVNKIDAQSIESYHFFQFKNRQIIRKGCIGSLENMYETKN